MKGAGGTTGGVGLFLGGAAMVVAGALIIVVGIIANLHVYFQPSSLFDTLLILTLIAGGIGLVARSLRAMPQP